MKRFSSAITNQKLLSKLGISTKQARLLASLTEQDLVCFEEIARIMGWSSICDARNQIKALEAKELVAEYDRKGRTILWGLTPQGIVVSQELRGHSVSIQASPVSTCGNPVEINGESEVVESLSAAQDSEMDQALNLLHSLPVFASRFPWFKEAVRSSLDLDQAA